MILSLINILHPFIKNIIYLKVENILSLNIFFLCCNCYIIIKFFESFNIYYRSIFNKFVITKLKISILLLKFYYRIIAVDTYINNKHLLLIMLNLFLFVRNNKFYIYLCSLRKICQYTNQYINNFIL